MRKLSLALLSILVCALGAAAQGRSNYSFDNFSSGGVTVFSPAKPAARPSMRSAGARKKGKKADEQTASVAVNAPAKPLVRRTVSSQQTMGVQDSLAMADAYKTSATNNSARMAPAAVQAMHGFSTGDGTIDSYILSSCARYGIDPMLIYAQMHQESSFKLRATSNKGARGLMQLMPGTAARFGVTNIYDPQQNIEGGVKYMRYLLDTFNGDVNLALAGYNAGEGAVMKYGYSIPPYNETQEYVRRISARYDMLRNPNTPRTAMRVSPSNLARLESKEAGTPLSIYEKAIYAVKMPDGRMRLVSQ
jgi:soluble lytic murein transglycosylase-like protein